MDPNSKDDRIRLMKAVEHSEKLLAAPRKIRVDMLKRYAGSEYSDEGASEDTPLNEIALAVNSLIQNLAGGEPQALVLTFDPNQSVAAYDQGKALNKASKRLGMRRKLHRYMRDAILGPMGIARIGAAEAGTIPTRELFPDLDEDGDESIGEMLMDVISFDNWVHDMTADSLEHIWFCGHRYWVRRDMVKHYLPELKPSDLVEDQEPTHDQWGGPRASTISRGNDTFDKEDYEPRLWLWDLYMPTEQVIITTQVWGTGEVAHVEPYTGMRQGPYRWLFYDVIPDQILPKSIIGDIALLHDFLNSTMRKLIEDTQSAKTILGYTPEGAEDAERVIDANNRKAVQMRDPDKAKEFNFGGPQQEEVAMLLQTRNIASTFAGNLDSYAGLGPQADTLGQEKMIQSAASQKINAMSIETASFVVELFEAIRWNMWHVPMWPERFTKEVPATGHSIQAQWGMAEADESGAFDDFEMQIEPYSMVYKSPEERIQSIIMLFRDLITPAMAGGLMKEVPDFGKLMEIVAQYMNLPELRHILRIPGMEEALQQAGQGKQSPVTTRNYVRHGSPGMGQAGAAQQMTQQAFAGAGREQ